MDGNMAMILGIIAVVFVVVCVFLSFVPLGLWISALSSGVHVSMGALIGMKIRHIKPHRLVQPLIKANKAGLGLRSSCRFRPPRPPLRPAACRPLPAP